MVVRVTVGTDGRPVGAEVARSSSCPDLDRAALDACLRARFTPARGPGGAVEAAVEQPIRFALRR